MTKHHRGCACKRCKAVDDVLAAALELAQVSKRHEEKAEETAESTPPDAAEHGSLRRMLERLDANKAVETAARRLLAALNTRPQKVKRAVRR